MKKASGEFAGYPIQIAYLVENYANRPKDALAEGWIVSRSVRDLSLSSLSLREAAHLRMFCAALAAFDAYICIMRQTEKEFKRLLDGIKPTWKNIFSKLRDLLEAAAFSW